MENNEMICPICGEPTNVYMGKARKDRLCKKHGKMRNDGLIDINDQGFFFEVATGKILNPPAEATKRVEELKGGADELTCIICGEPSNGKPQCKSCYYKSVDAKEGIDKNSSVHKLRDHYYNLKERIYIIDSLEETQRQCIRLIGIAMLDEELYGDTSLIERAYRDSETLIERRKQFEKPTKDKEKQKEDDEQKAKIHTSMDGHNLDSDMEVRIDDLLYNSCILHAYGKSIDEFTENRKKCDWFIPIINTNKGIYIEYWGMSTPEYLKSRAEKEELYKKHRLPLIGIEKDDPKMDTQTFRSNLIRDLRRLAEEYYHYIPDWLK